MKNRKAIKIVSIVLALIIGLPLLTVGIYVCYVAAQYYRIADYKAEKVENNRDETVKLGEEYSVTSYNLGFGAYSPEYSFFMDTGVMNSGKAVKGKYAKGVSKADVRKNVDGQISTATALDTDFYFFQEVDTKADRSYKINMRKSITDKMSDYGYSYAQNFHTANLIYPLNDPIGQSVSGILSLSKYRIDSAVRRSFPITEKFIDKLFDLDRCFMLQYLPIDGSDKKLVMLNLHMSAYDEGGKIRAKQLTMLNAVLSEERGKGNYVVAGGDFNHCLIADNFESDEEALSYFPSDQKTPDWVKNSVLRNSELTEGFTIAASLNAATCRGADIPYEKGVNYSTVIDGFIVSDNIEVTAEYTHDTEYAYSDHNPVVMKFILK